MNALGNRIFLSRRFARKRRSVRRVRIAWLVCALSLASVLAVIVILILWAAHG